ITKEINRNDYILKLDSDVMFISDKIFKEVITGESEAVGQYTKKGYMEGGSCFLRGSLVSRIVGHPIYKAVNEAAAGWYPIRNWQCPISLCPEDRAISELIRKSGGKLRLIKFRLPSERSTFSVDKITREHLEGYSILHFSHWCGLQEKQMAEVWGRLNSDS
ncbi:MAG: hypothetical protein JRI96_13490, partial [Deltaproteobacteria bacterium]|nr:hypothetical protein [Deltaproteobacteria bacterium]